MQNSFAFSGFMLMEKEWKGIKLGGKRTLLKVGLLEKFKRLTRVQLSPDYHQ